MCDTSYLLPPKASAFEYAVGNFLPLLPVLDVRVGIVLAAPSCVQCNLEAVVSRWRSGEKSCAAIARRKGGSPAALQLVRGHHVG
jgi:hypothetical protein